MKLGTDAAGNRTEVDEGSLLCEVCRGPGLKSRIHFKTSIKDSHEPVYYDEEGKLHLHEHTIKTWAYECSNGHKWSKEKVYGGCWCGWPEKS